MGASMSTGQQDVIFLLLLLCALDTFLRATFTSGCCVEEGGGAGGAGRRQVVSCSCLQVNYAPCALLRAVPLPVWLTPLPMRPRKLKMSLRKKEEENQK